MEIELVMVHELKIASFVIADHWLLPFDSEHVRANTLALEVAVIIAKWGSSRIRQVRHVLDLLVPHDSIATF